ncbi:MAG: geranyl transferase [Moraxellaceae bacterium]|jgi:geranylgeranyl pyrophosphate synthase|nr:geranyl transferase [Moraxellaceae bacterium]
MTTPEHSLLSLARQRFPDALDRFLARQPAASERLADAVRYAATNGGKRVRPALAYGAALACGAPADAAEPAALAIELIHCYSLVHDDLPAMDDDDLRRGLPTCHKAFDEATAILAGDALQSLAFLALAEGPLPAGRIAAQLAVLARAAADMAAGQALDIAAEGQRLDLAALENVHRHKTGALIRAATTLGALAAGADDQRRAALDLFADRLGLAFQVHDDVLDVIGETARIGKPAGSDAAREKSTYPALLGLESAQALAVRLHDEAVAALEPLGEAARPLRELADFLVARDH